MAEDGAVTLYNKTAITDAKKNPFSIKVGLAQILRGGAIVEVSTLNQAKLAEEAGACCLVITEPNQQGISLMLNPSIIKQIKRAVSIPIMARSRVGHFVEAQILERVGVDYIDESEVLAITDEDNFINKHKLRCPFICGCRNLGEASVKGEIRVLNNMDEDEVFAFSKKVTAPYDLVAQTKQMGRLPVVHFAAGEIVTPADAALMMQLGCDGVFVGSEVFDNCSDPFKRVRGIVKAVRHYNDPHVVVQNSCGLEEDMEGLNVSEERIEPFGEGV
ncbi:putative pyridoxal 5'-phosphate synthase subunit PDX1 [Hibiscus syriacus]|uniref:Pyridoxal 5'-phosphate synthase subunit PDX1 n=1 Tax=Hibiscus syriacus TaxID=106335 RepID=A0A6A3A946_HIBSY|nr:putative pyridoxal 5'-phosphate synthase subunit PDX1 [Hibiscus syriacus]